MICPKCGTSVPPNRNTCINCGITIEKNRELNPNEGADSFNSSYITEVPDYENKEEDYLSMSLRAKDKYPAIGVMGVLILIGIILTLIINISYFFLPWLSLLLFYGTVIIPLIGIIFLLTGFYKTGVVFGYISSGILFPSLPYVRKYLSKIWKWGEFASREKKKGSKEKKIQGVILKPSILVKLIVIISLLAVISAPMSAYLIKYNEPLLHIRNYNVPDKYTSGSIINIGVSLYNYGHQSANEDDIVIGIVHSGGEVKFEWTGGDIEPFGMADMDCRFRTDLFFDLIKVYLNGVLVDEKEIEEWYFPG